MFTDTEAPGTSTPVLAITNFTVCICEFPATQMRPSAETTSGLPPMVTFMPTKFPKSLRKGGLFKAKPVRKLVAAGPLHWKLAVTVCGADIVTICGLPDTPPVQFTNVQPEAGVAVSCTGVPLL